MKRYFFTLFYLTIVSSLFAQSNNPILKKTASNIADFIPNGWKLIYEAKGDLNKDGLIDEALIVENADLKNFISNKDRLGGDTLNINPRILLVVFRQKNSSYRLVAKNDSFIPSQNDEENTCLADPISETGAVVIKKGLLIISFQYWLSCGSYGVNNNNYTFRFQNKKFELIGTDENYFSRASGEEIEKSFNFSTNRMSVTTGGNMFDEKVNKPKTKFKKIPAKKLLDLATITTDAVDAFIP